MEVEVGGRKSGGWVGWGSEVHRWSAGCKDGGGRNRREGGDTLLCLLLAGLLLPRSLTC